MKILILVAAVVAAVAPLAQAQTLSRQLAQAPFAAPRQTTSTFNLTLDLEQVYRNGNWKDTLRTTYSRFNRAVTLPGGAMVPAQPARILREQSANGGTSWNPTRRRHRLYNAANSVVNDTSYTFNATTGVVTPRFMSATTYNAAGNIAQLLARFNLGSTWQNSGRDTYTYDAQGRLTTILLEGFVGGGFYNSSQTLYTYNAQGQVTEVEDQQDNGQGTGWLPFFKDLYTYDAQGRVQTVVFQFAPTATSGYQNSSRDTNAYDAANGGRIQSVARDAWAGTTWLPDYFFTWSYDPDGNTTFLTRQRQAGTALRNNYRNAYTYQAVLATKPNALNAALVALPNPAAVGTAATLRYELPTAAPVAVAVFDAAGRTVAAVPAAAQAAGPHTLALPALATPGLYLVRLSAGAQSQTVRLVVE